MTEKATDMDGDIRARVVTLEHASAAKEQRLSAIESWQRQRDIDSARNDEKWTAMEARIDTRFSGIESSLKDVQGSLSWVTKLIIGGIIMAVVAFMVGGGFSPSG